MDLYDMLFARLAGGGAISDEEVAVIVEDLFNEKASDMIEDLLDKKTEEISQEDVENLWGD